MRIDLKSRASMIFALPSAPSWLLGQTGQYCAERFADHWALVSHPLVCHYVEHVLGLLPQAATPAETHSLASNQSYCMQACCSSSVHIASKRTNGRYSVGACCIHAPRSGSNNLTSCRSTLSRVLSLISESLQSRHRWCLRGTATVSMQYIHFLNPTCTCTPRWTADPLSLSEKFSKIHKILPGQHVVLGTGSLPPNRCFSEHSMTPLRLNTSADITLVLGTVWPLWMSVINHSLSKPDIFVD